MISWYIRLYFQLSQLAISWYIAESIWNLGLFVCFYLILFNFYRPLLQRIRCGSESKTEFFLEEARTFESKSRESARSGAHFHLDWNRTNVLDNTNSIGHLSWKPNNNRTFLSCSLEQRVSNGKFSAMTENNTQSNSSTVHTGLKSN